MVTKAIASRQPLAEPAPRWLRCLGALALGCASYQGTAQDVTSSTLSADPGWRRIENLPLNRQAAEKDCGAAALSSVLKYWERVPKPATERTVIDAALRRSPKEGLSAGALRDYARREGFRAYVFHGAMTDLTHEIEQKRPVIVGVHKALSDGKRLTHYEVFLGVEPQKKLVLTFDPSHGLRENSLRGFAEEWVSAGQLTLVILPPEGATQHEPADPHKEQAEQTQPSAS